MSGIIPGPNMMMNRLLQFIRDKFAPKSQESILLKACREGNPHAVYVALKAGANPNALTYMGEYSYSPKDYETQHTGTVSITPILLAATSAKGNEEEDYYRVVELLMNHPKTDLDHVVIGHRKEWKSEQHHADGFPPTFEEDYHYSLRQVLNQRGLPQTKPATHPSNLYPMSPYMASIIADFLLEHQNKENELKKAFSYVVEGLVTHETNARDSRLRAKAADQKVPSL